jgi:hypothetical protein
MGTAAKTRQLKERKKKLIKKKKKKKRKTIASKGVLSWTTRI